MSVISLPDRDEAVAKAVDQVWEHYLQYVEDLDDLTKERKRKPPVAAALEGFCRRRRLRGDPVPEAGDDSAGSTSRSSRPSSRRW